MQNLEQELQRLGQELNVLKEMIMTLSFQVEELSRANLTDGQKSILRRELNQAKAKLGLA